jgi:hypothetical protein
MKFLVALAVFALLAAKVPAPLQANVPTDAQVVAAAEAQAGLACPDYSPERGDPGIAAVPVSALKTLAGHHFVLCPDVQIKGEMAVVWYPAVGVFAWRAGDATVVKTLAEIVDRIARLDDFPEGVTVWDSADEELGSDGVPEFKLKDGYVRGE